MLGTVTRSVSLKSKIVSRETWDGSFEAAIPFFINNDFMEERLVK